MAAKRGSGVNEWRGHRIITEDELIRAQHQIADEPAYRRVRLRHGIILGLLAAGLIAALLGAYLVNTGQWVIPAFAPKPAAATPTGVPSCPTQDIQAVPPRQVRVNVFNAAGTAGLAGATATQLKKREFRIGRTGNQSLAEPDVVAVIRSGPAGYGQALSLQRQFKGAIFVPDPSNTGTTLDLVLGKKYQRMIATAKVKDGAGKLACPAPKDRATPKLAPATSATAQSSAPTATSPNPPGK